MIRNYLATLHTRPEHHVKRFALLVSGCFTLLIFAIWLNFKFGPGQAVIAQAPADESAVPAESPATSLKANVSDAWSLITGEIDKAKAGLQSVDVQGSYTQN